VPRVGVEPTLGGFSVPNVDWHAHLGGLLGGALAAFILRAVPTRQRNF